MNELDKLIKKLILEKGGSRKDYLNLLNAIAHHETGGKMDSTLHQLGGGPGRGLYQFEVGKNAGAITAARRTKRYYEKNNMELPSWLKKASSGNDLDVSNLTPEQQQILFLGNMKEHPKADMSKVFNGEQSTTDFWANYHWAGDKKDRAARVKSFNNSMSTFKPIENNPKPTEDLGATFNNQQDEARAQMVKRAELEKAHPQESWLAGQAREIGNLVTDPRQFGEDFINQWRGYKTSSDRAYDKSKASKQEAMTNLENNFTYGGKMAMGGSLFNTYNVGGLHHQNRYGGIPIGNGNSVEQGESSFKMSDGSTFVFTNRLAMGGSTDPKKKNLNNIQSRTVPTENEMNQINTFINKVNDEYVDRGEFKGGFINDFIANNTLPYGDWSQSPSYIINNDKLFDLAEGIYNKKYSRSSYRDSIKKYSKHIKTGRAQDPNSSTRPYRPENINASYDALRLHQGIPQKYGSFVKSKYTPSVSKDKNAEYFALTGDARNEIIRDLTTGKSKDFLNSDEKELIVKGSVVGQAALKNFKYSKGEDEKGKYISYYDKNDYHNILDWFGKPFEIYDRIYYEQDKKTKKYKLK